MARSLAATIGFRLEFVAYPLVTLSGLLYSHLVLIPGNGFCGDNPARTVVMANFQFL